MKTLGYQLGWVLTPKFLCFGQAQLQTKEKVGPEENETHVVVIIAVPSDPRKRPKKPATELPSKGKKTISRYIRSSLLKKNQTMFKRPVIETKTC